jgi:crotonobetainyl-CoA:carnitine CoA-transferase CaiB-like acyl-CoA transferase
LHLPPTLFADMGGALMATQAVLQAVSAQRREGHVPAAAAQAEAEAPTGKTQPGQYFEVALADAAAFLALPRRWGLTRPQDAIGGAHAGYQVYACRDGRIAVAALEPHFARRLMEAADLRADTDPMSPEARQRLNAFFAAHSTDELDAIAASRDIPMHSLAA